MSGSTNVYVGVPQTKPSDFTPEPDRIAALRGVKQLLEDAGQEVPAWIVGVIDEADKQDGSSGKHGPRERPGGGDRVVDVTGDDLDIDLAYAPAAGGDVSAGPTNLFDRARAKIAAHGGSALARGSHGQIR